MGKFYDSVPVSAIVRIRDMMYTVKDPFRLDQGDVSFDAPDTFKQAVAKAMVDNRTHYLPTPGIPQLRKLFAEKIRAKNGIPVESDDEVVITNGGTHGIYAVLHALLEPGDEMIVPDPEWPPTMAITLAAGGVPVQVPLHERLGWRWDIDEVERAITPKTRVLYINSPNNPSGGILTRKDIERLAAIARERDLWVLSDEAYEDIIYNGEHVSIASLPGMYERTIPIYTMSKSYAITGVRVGYFAIKDKQLRDRATRSCSTPQATCPRSRSTAPSARSKARKTALRSSGRSCRPAATSSTRSWQRRRPACSQASRRMAHSTRS